MSIKKIVKLKGDPHCLDACKLDVNKLLRFFFFRLEIFFSVSKTCLEPSIASLGNPASSLQEWYKSYKSGFEFSA